MAPSTQAPGVAPSPRRGGLRNTIKIEIPGVPVPKGRPRVGRGRTYTPRATSAYERAVGLRCTQRLASIILAFEDVAPLALSAYFYLPIPKSWSKRKREDARHHRIVPAGKPDLDNLLKSVLDGCQGIVFKDDAQIVRLEAMKLYAVEPKVVLFFKPWRETEIHGRAMMEHLVEERDERRDDGGDPPGVAGGVAAAGGG